MNWPSILVILILATAGLPLPARGQQPGQPPPAPEETVGTQDLPPRVCPVDHTDGPLHADGREYFGIPARRIVEGFLGPPHDGFDRVETGTQDVRVDSLRVLADATDRDVCLRLTSIFTGGSRSAPPPPTWVYFTAGGFYFVSQWKPAQALSNYTTSYGHVMVFDRAFNLLGAYAF